MVFKLLIDYWNLIAVFENLQRLVFSIFWHLLLRRFDFVKLVSPLDKRLNMLEHLFECFVVLRLLHDLLVLEVVEAVCHSQANLVLVFQVAHHKFETKLLERR